MKKETKNSKGFTLIELLVVVAIIGILAAVGVVAYNGYTSAAKKNSSKTMHAQVMKYIAAEATKCSIDDGSEIFGSKGTGDTPAALNCNNMTAAKIVSHLTGADSPMEHRDPFDGGASVVSAAPEVGGKNDAAGNVVLTVDATDTSLINISTCYDDDSTTLCATSVVLTNSVQIE